METCIWSTITFISNARTILRQLEQKAINTYFLQPSFLKIESFFAGNSIKTESNVIKPYLRVGKTLKPFLEEAWENLPPSWIISGAKSKKTPNTN